MGLDMYLYKREKHADKRYNDGYRYDNTEIAYWRKANAIRGWLVNNGVIEIDDNCVSRPIDHELIQDLIDDCKVVINKYKETVEKLNKDGKQPTKENTKEFFDVAESIMPRSEGFFFGSDRIDRSYIDELENTVDQLTTVLETTTDDDELIYSDWW